MIQASNAAVKRSKFADFLCTTARAAWWMVNLRHRAPSPSRMHRCSVSPGFQSHDELFVGHGVRDPWFRRDISRTRVVVVRPYRCRCR